MHLPHGNFSSVNILPLPKPNPPSELPLEKTPLALCNGSTRSAVLPITKANLIQAYFHPTDI